MMSLFSKLRNFNVSINFFIRSLFLLLTLSCSNGEESVEFDYPLEGDTLSVSDITGNWTASSAQFQLLGAPNTQEIVSGGGSVSMGIQKNGRIAISVRFPGEAPTNSTGQLGFSGSQLVYLDDMDEPGDEAFFNIQLVDDKTFNIAGTLEFDLDGNGSFEETAIAFTMVR